MPKLLLVLELEESPNEDLVNLVNHYQNSKNIKFELWLITNNPSFRNCFDYGAQKIYQKTHKNHLETVFGELINNNSDFVFFLDSYFKVDHSYSDNILALLQSTSNLASARGSILTKIEGASTIQENLAILGSSPANFYDLALNKKQRYHFRKPYFVLANYLIGSIFRLAPIKELSKNNYKPLNLHYFLGTDLSYMLQHMGFNHMYLPISKAIRSVPSKYSIFLKKVSNHLRFSDKLILKYIYSQSFLDFVSFYLYAIRKTLLNPNFLSDLSQFKNNLQNFKESSKIRHQCLNPKAEINSFELEKHCLIIIE